MGRDDVPSVEMHLFRAGPDPIDAALRGDADDPAVEALVADLRSAYVTDEPRPRSAALTAFAGPGDGAPDPATAVRPPATAVGAAEPARSRSRVVVGLAAFAATLTGKIVLGSAVAAAALGGLHAADVVDVPLLPEVPRAPASPTTVPDVADPVELPAAGEGPARPGADAPTVADTPADDTPGPDTPADDAPETDGAPVDTRAGDRPQRPGPDVAEDSDDEGDAPTSVPPTTGPPAGDPTDEGPADPPVDDDASAGTARPDEDPAPAGADEGAADEREDFATNP